MRPGRRSAGRLNDCNASDKLLDMVGQQGNRVKIIHLTSAHPRRDTRIFVKMCCSLAANGHDVTLIVADGLGGELRNGVTIVDAGASSGRLGRMLDAPRRILKRALALDADIYHLHDPELLPIGLKLQRSGKRVIFDSHEDYSAAILDKHYLPRSVRPAVSRATSIYERYVCLRLAGVIAATPFIRDKFLRMGIRCLDVNNFPILSELSLSEPPDRKDSLEVCYVGSIAKTRGVEEIVRALELVRTNVRLSIAGILPDLPWLDRLRREAVWDRVVPLGFLDREGVKAVLGRSIAGLVTLHPTPAYRVALPVKMFEYMSAGLPVIASDFPLWREIVEGNDCGLCVDPLDPSAIAAAIDRLVSDPGEVSRMGINGRRAVLERYNWEVEERKLLDFYSEVMGAQRN